MIILDFGSGETCKNDPLIIKRMIDSLKEVDSGKEYVVIKWQLFDHDIPYQDRVLTRLEREMFGLAYNYAAQPVR